MRRSVRSIELVAIEDDAQGLAVGVGGASLGAQVVGVASDELGEGKPAA